MAEVPEPGRPRSGRAICDLMSLACGTILLGESDWRHPAKPDGATSDFSSNRSTDERVKLIVEVQIIHRVVKLIGEKRKPCSGFILDAQDQQYVITAAHSTGCLVRRVGPRR
jgi:hypothetical protein